MLSRRPVARRSRREPRGPFSKRVRPRKATCVAKDCTGRRHSSRGRARTHRSPARTHPSCCPSRPLVSHRVWRHQARRTSRPRLSFRYAPATGRTFRRTGLLSAFRSHARASRLLHCTRGLTSPSPALSSYEEKIRAFVSDQFRQALTSWREPSRLGDRTLAGVTIREQVGLPQRP